MIKTLTLLIFLLLAVNCMGQDKIDSTAYRMYIADRDRFLEQQETVKSKNTYLQLQGAITLLNMYIANEEKNFKFQLERK